MGTGAEFIVPALLTLGSAGLNYYNERQVGKKQDQVLANQIAQQGRRQSEADQAVSDAMRERALSTSEQDRSGAANQYLQQVRAAQANATRGLGQVGAVSNAYQQSANDAALGIGDYANTTANLMARIDAPLQQRQREGQADARLSMDLDDVARRNRSDDYLAQLRLRGVKRNPWIDLASSLMGVGAGYAAQAGGGQSLAGVQSQAKAGADFGIANRQLANANTNKILTGWQNNAGKAWGF